MNESADSGDVRLQIVTTQAIDRQCQLGGGNTRGTFSCTGCLHTACGGARMAYRLRQAIPLNASPVARLYFVNMATGGNINIDNTEVLAAVYNFIDGPNWSRVLNAVLLEDEEDSTVATIRQRAAGHGVGESPVRVEGYVEFIVPRYPEAAFKEHFRMNRSTFTVCVQHFYFCFFFCSTGCLLQQ